MCDCGFALWEMEEEMCVEDCGHTRAGCMIVEARKKKRKGRKKIHERGGRRHKE